MATTSSMPPFGGRFPRAVSIREVGPRDGLQSEPPLGPADRAALIDHLAAAGCQRIEAVSFVSERAVPAMAGAGEVLRLLTTRERFRLTALVPNLRGAAAALAAGVDEITATISASPAYNERNVRMTIDESVREIARICELALEQGTPVDGVVSFAFGSPYEGDIAADEVRALCGRLVDSGCATITLADTTGIATPRLVEQTLAATGTGVGLHLHDTRGAALVNAYAGLQAGVARFDTAVGGLGGSPFASEAGGNLATEELVSLLDDFGISTGIDLGELIGVSAELATLLGKPLPSRITAAGPTTRPPAQGPAQG